MSIKDETGRNIVNAFKVVRKTYENIEKFLADLDNVADKEGYYPISLRFLRWRSDQNSEGWLIGSFVKVYQSKKDPDQDNKTGLKDGPVYAVEIDLLEEKSPLIYLSKFVYDFKNHDWDGYVAVSEHWGFYYPVRNKDEFNMENKGEYVESKPKSQKIADNYWGLVEVVFKKIELVDVDSPEKIKSLIIDEFKTLKNY